MDERLVLHICCAPDEAWVVHTLRETRKLHCYFCNPNIDTRQEYARRLREAHKVARLHRVDFSSCAYSPHLWEEAVGEHRHTPEGGARCEACFLLRLRCTAAFTSRIGWPSFTSVMSISPHKDIPLLDKTGTEAAQRHGVVWESFAFRKKDGYRNSVRLSNVLGLYRQNYCGCRLSRNEALRRREAPTPRT